MVNIRGIEYDSFEQYLYNVHANLVSKFVDLVKQNPTVPPDLSCDEFVRVKEFEIFCEKYLGYKYDENNYKFIELTK